MNKKIFLILCLALLSSCAQLPTSHDGTKDLVLKKVRPALEKIFAQENPINPPEWTFHHGIKLDDLVIQYLRKDSLDD